MAAIRSKRTVFTVSADDFHEGSMGICLECGELAYGVEPDARGYVCESCDASAVHGLEEALIMGRIDVDECE